jgi:hypothetical protein
MPTAGGWADATLTDGGRYRKTYRHSSAWLAVMFIIEDGQGHAIADAYAEIFFMS